MADGDRVAVIRVGEHGPGLATRRIDLGVLGLVALRRSAAAAGLPPLPPDLVVEPSPAAAALAGIDVEAEVARAAALLREHHVLDDDGPVPAVAANLAAVVTAPRRLRIALEGPGTSLVAYHWVDARIAGSLVREDRRCVLSLFDARRWGDELVAPLPDPAVVDGPRRAGFTVPAGSLTTLAALEDLPSQALGQVGLLAGADPAVVTAVQAWGERTEAVLHVTVPQTRPERLPAALVWFLDRWGWYSARTGHADDGTRTVTVAPARRDDLRAAVAALVTGAWT